MVGEWLEQAPILGDLRLPPKGHRTKRAPPKNVNDFMLFIPASSSKKKDVPIPSNFDLISSTLITVSTTLAAAVTGLDSRGVVLSCIPVMVPFTSPGDNTSISILPYSSERSIRCQKGLISITVTQGCIALFQFIIGDTAGGFLSFLMAGVGLYSALPTGLKWLPTFVIMSFINGSIQFLGLVERTMFGKFALMSFANPAVVNIYHLFLMSGPILSFASVYVGYQLLKEIRQIAAGESAPLEQYDPLASTNLPGLSMPQFPSSFAPFAGLAHKLDSEKDTDASTVDSHPKAPESLFGTERSSSSNDPIPIKRDARNDTITTVDTTTSPPKRRKGKGKGRGNNKRDNTVTLTE